MKGGCRGVTWAANWTTLQRCNFVKQMLANQKRQYINSLNLNYKWQYCVTTLIVHLHRKKFLAQSVECVKLPRQNAAFREAKARKFDANDQESIGNCHRHWTEQQLQIFWKTSSGRCDALQIITIFHWIFHRHISLNRLVSPGLIIAVGLNVDMSYMLHVIRICTMCFEIVWRMIKLWFDGNEMSCNTAGVIKLWR